MSDAAALSLLHTCPKCEEHWIHDHEALLHAFASVGIEQDRSVPEMANSYFGHFHANNHYEEAA